MINQKKESVQLIDKRPGGLAWAKRILLFAASRGPEEFKGFATAAKYIDLLSAKDKGGELQRQVDDLYGLYSRIPELIIGEVVPRIIEIIKAVEPFPGLHFTRSSECLAICKELSIQSIAGVANDPLVSRRRCLELIYPFPKNRPDHVALMMVTSELSENGFIHIHPDETQENGIGSIGPGEHFFCLTDVIFQAWDPEEDIITFIMAADKDTMVSIPRMDEKLGWSPRRMNSAIALLHLRGLIDNDQKLRGADRYVLSRVKLNTSSALS